MEDRIIKGEDEKLYVSILRDEVAGWGGHAEDRHFVFGPVEWAEEKTLVCPGRKGSQPLPLKSYGHRLYYVVHTDKGVIVVYESVYRPAVGGEGRPGCTNIQVVGPAPNGRAKFLRFENREPIYQVVQF
jgi:hypothetical protein